MEKKRHQENKRLELINELLGSTHLTEADVYRINSDYLEDDEKVIKRLFEHIAECRICRRRVPGLNYADFRRAYPLNYRDDYVKERFGYYTDPDPPPFFDEKITFREKLWRYYKYGDNYFFDCSPVSEWYRKISKKLFGSTNGKTRR